MLLRVVKRSAYVCLGLCLRLRQSLGNLLVSSCDCVCVSCYKLYVYSCLSEGIVVKAANARLSVFVSTSTYVCLSLFLYHFVCLMPFCLYPPDICLAVCLLFFFFRSVLPTFV